MPTTSIIMHHFKGYRLRVKIWLYICSLKAHLFCGGVTAPKEIESNAKLQEAYELGKQV